MYAFLTANNVHAYTCLLYTVDFDIPDTDLVIKKKLDTYFNGTMAQNATKTKTQVIMNETILSNFRVRIAKIFQHVNKYYMIRFRN